MPSLQERDRILRESWVDVRFRTPTASDKGPHHAIHVNGVIDDPRYHVDDVKGPFVEIVAYWPALQKFTVTHTCRADDAELVHDVEVRVTFWQDLMPLPWG